MRSARLFLQGEHALCAITPQPFLTRLPAQAPSPTQRRHIYEVIRRNENKRSFCSNENRVICGIEPQHVSAMFPVRAERAQPLRLAESRLFENLCRIPGRGGDDG
jgi:hypothetical protein